MTDALARSDLSRQRAENQAHYYKAQRDVMKAALKEIAGSDLSRNRIVQIAESALSNAAAARARLDERRPSPKP
jgi:hypothetical protein